MVNGVGWAEMNAMPLVIIPDSRTSMDPSRRKILVKLRVDANIR